MSMLHYDAMKWCIKKHKDTNHLYDKYISYEFHLRMVNHLFKKYKHLIPKNLYTNSDERTSAYGNDDITLPVLEIASWGHDLIENTRTSYGEIMNVLQLWSEPVPYIADVIYALTNEKGKTRMERGNDDYYERIAKTPGSDFVKLCDRLANGKYSAMTGSSMFNKYQKENPQFISHILWGKDLDTYVYKLMIDDLITVLK